MAKRFIKISLIASAIAILTMMLLDSWSLIRFLAYLLIYIVLIVLGEWAFEKGV